MTDNRNSHNPSNKAKKKRRNSNDSRNRISPTTLQTFPRISLPDSAMMEMSTSALAQMIGASFMSGSHSSILGQIALFILWRNDASQLTAEQAAFLQSMSSGKDLQTLVNHLRGDDVFQVVNLLNKILKDSKSSKNIAVPIFG